MSERWVNERELESLPAYKALACEWIIRERRRPTVKPLVRREANATYSVLLSQLETDGIFEEEPRP